MSISTFGLNIELETLDQIIRANILATEHQQKYEISHRTPDGRIDTKRAFLYFIAEGPERDEIAEWVVNATGQKPGGTLPRVIKK